MTVDSREADENSVEFYSDRVVRIVPASGKIYDLTHTNTNEHSASLPAGYPANTKAIVIYCERVAGSGPFLARSVSGQPLSQWQIATGGTGIWYRAADGLFYYALSVAYDDWDIYAVAYYTG